MKYWNTCCNLGSLHFTSSQWSTSGPMETDKVNITETMSTSSSISWLLSSWQVMTFPFLIWLILKMFLTLSLLILPLLTPLLLDTKLIFQINLKTRWILRTKRMRAVRRKNKLKKKIKNLKIKTVKAHKMTMTNEYNR